MTVFNVTVIRVRGVLFDYSSLFLICNVIRCPKKGKKKIARILYIFTFPSPIYIKKKSNFTKLHTNCKLLKCYLCV